MLHVAFLELTTGTEEQLFTRKRGLRVNQGHDILQLVTEAERAAGVIGEPELENAGDQ